MIALSVQLLDLPDDILLEILALLPVVSVVVHCRPVCHKLNTLSREHYLWVRFFNRTRDMLCRPIELTQLGTSEFEKSICRVEMLKNVWGDKSALATSPRFWRGSKVHRPQYHGSPVAIMGDYIIFWHTRAFNEQQRFTWISARDWNGPIVFRTGVPPGFFNTQNYMDLDTGIFYITFPSDAGLEVAGFQVDPRTGLPREVIRYSLPTRHRNFHPPRGMEGGFLCLDYGRSAGGAETEVDVVDIRRGTLFQLVLPHLASLFPEDRQYLEHGQRAIAVAETHLICGSLLTSTTVFAVFSLPAGDQGSQLLGNGATLPAPRTVVHLDPVLIGKFPFYLERWWAMPRSATSFVVIGVHQPGFPDLENSTTVIQMFSFNVGGGKNSFGEVGSVTVRGRFRNCLLRSPPSNAQYVLGILAVAQIVGDGSVAFKRMNFALRIDFPDPNQDPESGDRCEIALTRIQLAPAIDEEKEGSEFQCFDHFSGRAVVLLPLGIRNGVVFDYL